MLLSKIGDIKDLVAILKIIADADQQLLCASSRVFVGVFLVMLGIIVGSLSYFMGIVPMLAFGLASILIGVMVLYLFESESFAADLSLPSLLNIENLLEDLDLDKSGIYLPTSGPGASTKVFIPLALTDGTLKPPSDLAKSSRLFVILGQNPEDRGILLNAPGSGILSALERLLQVDLAKVRLEDLRPCLNSGFSGLGMAKVKSLEQYDDHIRIDMELTSLIDLETKLRELAPRLSEHLGTPIVSAAVAGTSKATGKYVSIRSTTFELPSRRLSITLQMS